MEFDITKNGRRPNKKMEDDLKKMEDDFKKKKEDDINFLENRRRP